MALAADVANLIVALRLDDSGFSGKLNKAAGQLKAMDSGLSQMGRGAGQVARGLDKIGTVAFAAAAGGLAAVVTTAASFEQAFAGVEKTVGGNEQQLADLEETLRGMARSMPVSFEELSAIAAEGGALGIARDSLAEFTDIVARLGVSTDLTTDQAATALGQMANVLGLSDQEMRDFADSLVALGNDGASTESEILDMTARFGAAGKMAGLSNEEILALSSTVSSMGIEAEAGGGALSRLFNDMTLNIGTASDEAVLMAETMGVSLGELRDRWEQDAGGVFEELLAHIKDLDQFEAAEFLQGLGITNTRDINAIMLLSEGVEEYRDQLATAQGQTDELNRESDKFFDTAQGQWQTLKNIVRDSAAIIGEELLPVTKEVLGDMADSLNDPKVREGLKDFGRDVAEGITDLLDALRDADFGPLMDTFKGAAEIAKAGFDAFRSLPSGVQSLVLAAVGVNKITGGALTSIASGVGNILMGALKVGLPMLNRGSTPLNPLFVSPVGGGLGGPGGVGGPVAAGGGRGVLGWALGALGVVSVAQLAEQIRPAIPDAAQATRDALGIEQPIIEIPWDLDELQWPLGPKGAPEWASFDFNPFESDKPDGNKPQMTQDERTEAAVRDAIPWLERNRDEVNDLNQSEGRRFAHLSTLTSEAKDAVHTLNASEGSRASVLQQRVTESKNAIHTLNASEGSRFSTANLVARNQLAKQSETVTKLSTVSSNTGSALQKQADALAAARAGNATLAQIRDKKSTVLVKTQVNTTVTLSAAQANYQLQSYRESIGSGGFI